MGGFWYSDSGKWDSLNWKSKSMGYTCNWNSKGVGGFLEGTDKSVKQQTN